MLKESGEQVQQAKRELSEASKHEVATAYSHLQLQHLNYEAVCIGRLLEEAKLRQREAQDLLHNVSNQMTSLKFYSF